MQPSVRSFLRAVALTAALVSMAAECPRFALAERDAEKADAVAAIGGEIKPDDFDQVMKLPPGSRDHWVWISDRVLRHNQLFDGDTGRALGTLDVSISLSGRLPLSAPALGELYVVESVYSRGHRGTRADYVTVYDAETLAYKDEIEIPPLMAETGASVALTAMLDGGRFLLVYNQAPQSVTVVDAKHRRVVASVETAGCACIYPTGERSFGMLCGDGTAVQVVLDAEGRESRLLRSEKFFDVVTDPLTEKGVRRGKHWLFASFEGQLHEVDFSADTPRLAERWSLFTEEERAEGWRIGGVQHLALHERTGELYSIVHKGGPGTHKDPGGDIWVYDVAMRKRTRAIKAPRLMLAFVRPLLGIERESTWYRALAWLESVFGGPGVHTIVVTQDDEPLLFVRHSDVGAVGVLDARTGVTLREIEEVGVSGSNMAVP